MPGCNPICDKMASGLMNCESISTITTLYTNFYNLSAFGGIKNALLFLKKDVLNLLRRNKRLDCPSHSIFHRLNNLAFVSDIGDK
ncbi:MAG: hypothetical protein A3H70_00665 [Candidatus Komeilibacteria bacterium RIFCSPLOWO2_02_FULL_48_11]|uniref:Uncharacterized protein n=1 Tax=Candidatus Komeilibacteria bacterium RIFCSPLOWO2_02_FULL_48_11 TaxID=1798553 RepID=A0A1G2BWK0_9BACT|nr:MAG: hypothetical protein A3H70_00665 [Candidatus Komeilibacteria bacterium RIFCSPLOWO2_02_FULL_48_11]